MEKDKHGNYLPNITIPLGGYVDSEIGVQMGVSAQDNHGYYHNARPLPYYSIFNRIKLAWHVLTYKADALYWSIDLNNSSSKIKRV